MDASRPLLELIEAQDQDDRDARAAIAARIRICEAALDKLGIARNSVAGKVLRLIARVAGHDALVRTRWAIAEDAAVASTRKSVTRAIEQLARCGLIRRGCTLSAQNRVTGVVVQIDWPAVHRLSEQSTLERLEWLPPVQIQGTAANATALVGPSAPPSAPDAYSIPSSPLYPNTPTTTLGTAANATAQTDQENSWADVVVVVSGLGVGRAEEALTKARDLGLSIADVEARIASYERLDAATRRPGTLYNWLAFRGSYGATLAPRSPPPSSAQRGDAMGTDDVQASATRYRIVRHGRQQGWTEEQIAQCCLANGVSR